MQTELLIVIVLKGLLELAGLFLIAQGALHMMAGAKRDSNIFYQILQIVTRPVLRFTRFITPRMVVDRHIPYVALLLVVWGWLILLFWILPELCGSQRVDCRELLDRKRAD